MQIKFTVKLRCEHKGKNFYVVTDSHRYTIDQNCDIVLDVDRDYRGQSCLSMFFLEGFTPGLEQRVSVVDILINGKVWQNRYPFCELSMMNNLYVDNRVISPCWELCFNGEFRLVVGERRNEFEHDFLYYRSKKRQDFVFHSGHLDANEHHDYWCFGSRYVESPCTAETHTDRWMNEPYLPEYKKGQHYDYGCFGCSYTRGTALKRGQEWPAQLGGRTGQSVINLAEAGLGADGVFLNLRCALDEFRMDRVIILWPSLNRMCLRWRVDEWHLRLPITLNSVYSGKFAGDQRSIWLPASGLEPLVQNFELGCVSGRMSRRSQRIIKRTVRLLRDRGVQAGHSSWDKDCYIFLRSLDLGDGLLPPFPPNDHGAMDRDYPSARLHAEWCEQIAESTASI